MCRAHSLLSQDVRILKAEEILPSICVRASLIDPPSRLQSNLDTGLLYG